MPEANTTLGILYLKRGQLAEAEEALRAELEAHPQEVKARFTLATVLELEGQSEEVLGLLRSVLNYQLGQTYQKLGRTDAAREQFEVFRKLKDKPRGRADGMRP